MQAKQADFAIITIREDEFKALASRFKLTPQRGASGHNYGISQIQTRDEKNRTVAIARCTEQGPQPAQQLAHDMINDLSPSLLLAVCERYHLQPAHVRNPARRLEYSRLYTCPTSSPGQNKIQGL